MPFSTLITMLTENLTPAAQNVYSFMSVYDYMYGHGDRATFPHSHRKPTWSVFIPQAQQHNLKSPDCEHSLGEMAICDTELDGRGSLQKPFIDAHVVFRHARGVKASFEHLPAATAIKTRQTSDRARRFLHILDDETGAVFHNFRHGAVGPCDHRRAAGHRLDHHQAERLRPINREEQRIRPAQKFLLLLTADLADEFDQRGI